MKTLALSLTLAVLATLASARAETIKKPWNGPDAIIVPDPYQGNAFDFDQAFSDPKVRAVLLRGALGLRGDAKVIDRAGEAKRRKVPFGIYLLGVSGTSYVDRKGRLRPGVDVIAQADLLVDLGRRTGATLLALDVEGTAPKDIALDDAERFIRHVEQRTGRFPAFYTDGSVAGEVARRYSAASAFGKTPLWIAAPSAPFSGNRVWPTYALWQFGAEWDCPKPVRARNDRFEACKPYRRYPINGSDYDLDVNLLNGGEAALNALFGAPSDP